MEDQVPDGQEESQSVENNVVALRKSRERWKALARQWRDEVKRLRQELEQAKNSPQ